MGDRGELERPAWQLLGAVVLAALVVPLIPFALFGELPGETWVEHPRPELVFALGVAVLAADIFLPVPSSLIAVFLGARLGMIWGTLAIATGLNLGTAVGYLTGRSGGSAVLARFASPSRRQSLASLEGPPGYLGLAVMRSIPLLAEASVLAAGAARWYSRRLAVLLVLANTALAVVYGTFGATGAARSSPAWLFAGGIAVPVLGVAAALLVHRRQ